MPLNYSRKSILQHNSKQFIQDLKSVREVMVYCEETCVFLKVRKMDILNQAETGFVNYYMTDKIFVFKRLSMVIR
jgi:hypothetical protein